MPPYNTDVKVYTKNVKPVYACCVGYSFTPLFLNQKSHAVFSAWLFDARWMYA
jgi:hypothetical protein